MRLYTYRQLRLETIIPKKETENRRDQMQLYDNPPPPPKLKNKRQT